MLKIMRTSPPVTRAMAQAPFFKRLVEGLGRKAKPGTKLHLLRIVRVVCDNHPERANLVEKFGLSTVVEQLGRQDDAILVREVSTILKHTLTCALLADRVIHATHQLAKEIAPSLVPAATRSIASRADLKPELRQGIRRATSDSPMIALEPKPVLAHDRDKKQKRRISRNKLK